MGLPSMNWAEVLDRIVVIGIAYVLALPIGWDREQYELSAGIRTFPLVAIASCGLVIVALRATGTGAAEQSRILQGLITGIGFIGGGAILKTQNSVRGTATAASLWNVGVMGAAVGYGLYDIAALLSLINFLTLRLLRPFKQEESQNDSLVARPNAPERDEGSTGSK
ncbi:MAG TPA: MgtC/SapB family protein [Bryobacteraceae bacterium]|nr:MgtC/SapB family protein [Bryobacteraceae bacterium]